MSVARPIVKGTRFMLTRRVRGRRFLLRPSKRTNEIIGYVVAVMQAKWGVRVHCLVAMSNHWHLVLSDPDAHAVEFQRDCHAFIARALNASHGEFENVWSSSPGSRVEAIQPSDLIAQMAYVMANPVEAGLVRHGRSWPGLRRAWPARPRRYARPATFFRGADAGGGWPDYAELELSRPPGYEELTDEQLAHLVRAASDKREQQFRRHFDRAGQGFRGRRHVLRQSRQACPRTREPRFGLSPTMACRDKWRRIERLQRNRHWLDAYRTALRVWRAGIRGVLFPHGTYKMRLLCGVSAAAPPT